MKLCLKPIKSRSRGAVVITKCTHANPRIHNPDNVGFAHRECNIAQGNRTLQEFYEWIYHSRSQELGKIKNKKEKARS